MSPLCHWVFTVSALPLLKVCVCAIYYHLSLFYTNWRMTTLLLFLFVFVLCIKVLALYADVWRCRNKKISTFFNRLSMKTHALVNWVGLLSGLRWECGRLSRVQLVKPLPCWFRFKDGVTPIMLRGCFFPPHEPYLFIFLFFYKRCHTRNSTCWTL